MTCAAQIAADYINGHCHLVYGNVAMASKVANGEMIDVFDHTGGGTHKYIPADRFTQELGEPEGAGVYGYWRMYDGSYLLRTCRGPLAWQDAPREGLAQWGAFANVRGE